MRLAKADEGKPTATHGTLRRKPTMFSERRLFARSEADNDSRTKFRFLDWRTPRAEDGQESQMKVKICPRCGQAFTATAAGMELLYSHLRHEHALSAADADDAVDAAQTEERVEPTPRELPRCH